MANNVIKFPTEERIRNRLKNKVNETIEIMDELYSQIDLCMENLCKLEEQATKVESAYSIILKEYAKSVEIHQMEARYLAYCKDAQVHWDGDKNCLVFHLPNWMEEEENE